MAQSRDLTVNIGWRDDALQRGTQRSARSTRQLGREIERSQREINRVNQNLAREEAAREQERLDRQARVRDAAQLTGETLVAAGTAAVAATGAAVKAAIDWESAWAGVTKTVDGSEAQMAALETSLRNMAKELPATHEEIAGVAEAAGQLGVQREAIEGFTRTMIDLGNTTNLTAEEAATAMAQFGNIMGTAQDDTDRLGSSLVALGNSSATTEADILSMAQRLAGAGNLIGATEADVLAMSAAMASVGIEAEAGGGSMSRVMQKIHTAVSDGGDAVQGFADVAGMSAKQFTDQWQDDPVEAINQFIIGLNGVESSGGNVVGVLSDLGIRSSEDVRTVLGLKGATDLLSDSLDTSARAWEENSALSEEAEKRYDTAASRIQMAWNSIKDAAIDVGGAIAPIVGGAADVVGALADAFGSLPDPVKSALGVLGGVGGAVALISGAALLAVPRIRDTRDALRELGVTGDKARGRMARFGKTIGKGGAVLVGLQLLGTTLDSVVRRDVQPNMEAFTLGLERLNDTGKATGEVARILGGDLAEFDEALDRVSASGFEKEVQRFFASLVGSEGAIGEAEATIRSLDEALSGMVSSGDIDTANEVFGLFAERAKNAGVSVGDLRGMLPDYAAAQEVANEEADKGATSQSGLAAQTGNASGATQDATEALQDYADQQRAMTDPVFALHNALRRQEEAERAVTEAVKTHGAKSDEAKLAQWNLAEAVLGVEQAALDTGLSVDAFESKLDEMVKQGKISKATADSIKGGLKGLREEAEDYQGTYNAKFNADTGQAREKINSLNNLLDMWDGREATGYAKLIPQLLAPDYQGSNTGLYNFNFPGGSTGGKIAGSGIKRYNGGGKIAGPARAPRTRSSRSPRAGRCA